MTRWKVPTPVILAEPCVTILDRNLDQDEFLLLCSDGVWGVLEPEILGATITHQLVIQPSLCDVGSEILSRALEAGSTDNLACVLIAFPAAPEYLVKEWISCSLFGKCRRCMCCSDRLYSPSAVPGIVWRSVMGCFLSLA